MGHQQGGGGQGAGQHWVGRSALGKQSITGSTVRPASPTPNGPVQSLQGWVVFARDRAAWACRRCGAQEGAPWGRRRRTPQVQPSQPTSGAEQVNQATNSKPQSGAVGGVGAPAGTAPTAGRYAGPYGQKTCSFVRDGRTVAPQLTQPMTDDRRATMLGTTGQRSLVGTARPMATPSSSGRPSQKAPSYSRRRLRLGRQREGFCS